MQVFTLMWRDQSDGGLVGVFQSMEAAEAKLESIMQNMADYTIRRSQYGVDYMYQGYFSYTALPFDLASYERYGKGFITFIICERNLE